MKGKIKFGADKVSVRGPLTDGGYVVSFYVGEYEQEQVAKLLMIPQQTPLRVEVKIDGQKD